MKVADRVERLDDIKEEIKELISEAQALLPKGIIRKRAEAYWIGHILGALDQDSDYSMTTMADSIEEIREEESGQ